MKSHFWSNLTSYGSPFLSVDTLIWGLYVIEIVLWEFREVCKGIPWPEWFMSGFCELPGALRQTLVVISQLTVIWLQTHSHFRELSVPLPPAFSFHHCLPTTAFDPYQIRVGKRRLGENVTQVARLFLCQKYSWTLKGISCVLHRFFWKAFGWIFLTDELWTGFLFFRRVVLDSQDIGKEGISNFHSRGQGDVGEGRWSRLSGGSMKPQEDNAEHRWSGSRHRQVLSALSEALISSHG